MLIKRSRKSTALDEFSSLLQTLVDQREDQDEANAWAAFQSRLCELDPRYAELAVNVWCRELFARAIETERRQLTSHEIEEMRTDLVANAINLNQFCTDIKRAIRLDA